MMILDTNVVSELIRPAPEPRVTAWLDSADHEEFAITAITAAELRVGVALLPAGQRRNRLHREVERLLDETFRDLILSYDAEATIPFAHIIGVRKRSGQPIGFPDAQIAAIAIRHQSALATRNVKDFAKLGLKLVNPWELDRSD